MEWEHIREWGILQVERMRLEAARELQKDKQALELRVVERRRLSLRGRLHIVGEGVVGHSIPC